MKLMKKTEALQVSGSVPGQLHLSWWQCLRRETFRIKTVAETPIAFDFVSARIYEAK